MIKFYLFKTFVLFFLLLVANQAWAQTRVTGKVTSAEDGTGLPGVSILEKGTTNGWQSTSALKILPWTALILELE